MLIQISQSAQGQTSKHSAALNAIVDQRVLRGTSASINPAETPKTRRQRMRTSDWHHARETLNNVVHLVLAIKRIQLLGRKNRQ